MRHQHLPLVALYVLAASCAAPTGDEDGDRGAAIAANAIVLDEKASDDAVLEEGRVTFPLAGHESLLGREAGDVLVAHRAKSAGRNNPNGFLRKIVSVDRAGDRVVVLTTPGSLTDAVRTGEAQQTFDIDVANMNPTPTGVESPSGAPAFGTKDLGSIEKSVDISGTKLDTGIPGLTVTIKKGKVGFKAGLDVGVKISWFSLKEFHAIAKGAIDASFELEVDYTLAKSFSKKFETTFYKSPTKPLAPMMIGPVPVSAGVRINFKAGCEVSMSGNVNLDVGAEASSSVALGIKYDGGWKGVSEHALKFTRIGPTATTAVQASMKCSITPEVEMMFYEVIGGYMSISPYAAFDIEPTLECPWRLHAGVEGNAGGRFDVLGYKLAEFNTKLFGFDANLASGKLGGWCGK